MNLRITLLMLAAALMLAACSENDASNPTSSETVAAMLGEGAPGPMRWAQELELTDDQMVQVRAIFESHREEREAIRQARRNGATQEEIEAQHEALRARVHEELAAVLTTEQLAKLEAWRQNRPRHRRGPMSDEDFAAHLDTRMARLTETLSLTPEQATQLRTLFEERHANRPAKGEGPMDLETWQQRHAEFLGQVEEILTPEQFEQFKSLHPGRQGGRGFGPGGPHGFGRGQGSDR